MYMPFILLRLWGWPGFWAFLIPNVLGCAAFGFVLDGQRSRALAAKLGWMCALFSAVTVAYQCYFAGWAAGWLALAAREKYQAIAGLEDVSDNPFPTLTAILNPDSLKEAELDAMAEAETQTAIAREHDAGDTPPRF